MTLVGIVIDDSDVHSENVCCGMVVIVAGNVTDTNDDAPLNTALPNNVTDDGMIIDTNDVHPWKELCGIDSIDVSRIT